MFKNGNFFPYRSLGGTLLFTLSVSIFLYLQIRESSLMMSVSELIIIDTGIFITGVLWLYVFFRLRQYRRAHGEGGSFNGRGEFRQLSSIVECSPEAIAIVDMEKQFTLRYVNGAWERLFGYSRAEALHGMRDPVLKELKKNTLLFNQFLQARLKSHAFFAEIEVKQKDGKSMFVEMNVAPLESQKGKRPLWFYALRDITLRRTGEEKMKDFSKKKMEFLSVAVHKIRTPLTGIKWFIELLMKDGLSPSAREYVKQIAVSNERMTQLADDLLDVSHIETGRKFDFTFKKTDVASIALDVMASQKLLAKMRKITIRMEPRCPKKLFMDVDADKIKKVFQNIINNAMKYSQMSGTVEIGCKKKENDVVWYVKDRGIGIPKGQQSHIFEKFFRADNAETSHVDGTGLGLYICKAIIGGHGGNIWFESEEGKGSTFYFSLPITSKKKKK